MFDKILIANRGEIACRVIATCQRLGIETVAVYSDADARALHVEQADIALRIGPAPATQSYLCGDRIIEAALQAGAQAIHPGYGFLSENPDFVAAVQAAGLTFIGPSPEAIRAMGLKDAAKALMQRSGVPVVPGYHGAAQDPDRLAQEAQSIGYPVLIKARAGGGGKGMRLVEDPANFIDALQAAQREAQASFGDPICLVEKFIASPRHVEIQVFGDAHGNIVHMFERDCSLQRRHQKVIEEAPAPGMPEDVRAAMGAAAVQAAKAIGYQGAGTVEFIADGSKGLRADGFWFMEMNTRLQVEHPVTEAILGLDLVELQLRVAAGEPLPMTQAEISATGHAVEARIYAEDVPAGFLPATGKIDGLAFPDAARFATGPLRIDAGFRDGDEITPHYDPMIAKLIAHGPDRNAALRKLGQALRQTRVPGVTANLSFLAALVALPEFVAGDVDTGLIARHEERWRTPLSPSEPVWSLAAIHALGLLDPPQGPSPWDRLRGWSAWGRFPSVVTLRVGEVERAFTIQCQGNGFIVNGQEVSAHHISGMQYQVAQDGGVTSLTLHETHDSLSVFEGATCFTFAKIDPLDRATLTTDQANLILAPMPGQVTRVTVNEGAQVVAGQTLLTLEAMKMEHSLTAARAGRVTELLVREGDQVANGALLVRLEFDDG